MEAKHPARRERRDDTRVIENLDFRGLKVTPSGSLCYLWAYPHLR